MSVRRLLRLPGASCPDEALTGDDVLDAYIRDLDARLLGSRHVRLLTLAEIKDHLMEAKAAAIASGLDERAAAGKAVNAMGSADDYAREQRATLAARFWKVALIWGAVVAIVTGLSQFLPALKPNPLRAFLIAAFEGVLAGLFTGVLMAFWLPQRWISIAQGVQNRRSAQFDVTYSRPVAVLMTISLAFTAAMSMAVVAVGTAGILDIFPDARVLVPWWLLVLFVVLIPAAAYEVSRLPRVFRVGPLGFRVNSWMGLERDVLWRNVAGVEIRRWTPARLLSRTGKYLEYRTLSGRTRRIWLRPDMLNFDRFLQLVEENVRRNSCPDGSTLPV